ncbi:UDP-glucuronosyltransferase 2B17-like [Mauremys mutica]|uniref:UDP-glucuronosyltransferase 2B17-like n=1 Tax=Mauremys mutica TaxID=74926 RepID=UPI001D168611|nr:UDP-glucuronosyltransferase 2B17-like [Mauremys mutica]
MLNLQCTCRVLVCLSLLAENVLSGKVLVWPADYSHWMNLKLVTEELASMGHNITVLVHSASLSVNATSASALHFEPIEVGFTSDRLRSLWEKFLRFWVYEKAQVSFWEMHSMMRSLSRSVSHTQRQICDGAVKSRKLLEKLRMSQYDVLLSDPVLPCGELLAELLRVPFIFTLRFSPGLHLRDCVVRYWLLLLTCQLPPLIYKKICPSWKGLKTYCSTSFMTFCSS